MNNWRNWLMSNMVLRNILSDFGTRRKGLNSKKQFTPYFKYKIGAYKSDMFLYFPKEPFPLRYYNEIFNKMLEFSGYEIIRYLEFHFLIYEDRIDFLRFLKYETDERLQRVTGTEHLQRLKTVASWIVERREELVMSESPNINTEISNTIREALRSNTHMTKFEADTVIQDITTPILAHVSSITREAEERFLAIARAFTTGNIRLNNQQHAEKLLQAFYLFSTVIAPGSKTNGLFKEFTATDLAFLLNMHFSEFKGMKPNTVQKKIAAAVEKVRFENPQVKKLNEALQEFFYS